MRFARTCRGAVAGLFALASFVATPLVSASQPPSGGAQHEASLAASRGPWPLNDAPRTAAAAPVFQVMDLFGVLAVTSTTQVLAIPLPIQFDAHLPADSASISWGGLARDPASAKIYVAGTSFVTGSSYLGLVDFTTGKETTIGTLTGEVVVDLAFDTAGHLYALTDNISGAHQHAVLSVDPNTASFSVAASLDSHGGGDTFQWFGAIAYNPADGFLYYSSFDGVGHLFIDKLALPSFTQTPVLQTTEFINPTAMAFAQGRLWIADDTFFVSADATNIAAGLDDQEQDLRYQTLDGPYAFNAFGLLPVELPCIPGPTTACIGNRFKIEVAYDATPTNGSGPANVVLESSASVKFTFFDPGNIELIVKMLDACVPFQKWWVFAGGLTNVGVTVTVTDTSNGAVKSYSSTKGMIFQAFADTEAFSCP